MVLKHIYTLNNLET